MDIRAWGQTDVGLKRDKNQDAFLIDEDLGLFIVADGMGGHRGGEVASALAVETVQETIKKACKGRRKPNPRELLLTSYQQASRRIFEKQEEEEELHGMGTTMVVAYVQDGHVYIGNVGDSRCYLFNPPQLWQITEDHSLVNEQLRAGLISEEEVNRQLPKNIITRSVGYEREVLPDFYERSLRPGEMYLLCSDGLTGMVDDLKITELLLKETPEKISDRCIEEAKKEGADDNITVMVVSVMA